MTLLTIDSAQSADDDGHITCEHCHRRFAITYTTEEENRPIINKQAQASLIVDALKPPSRPAPPNWRWLTTLLILSLILVSQATYFKRNDLAEINMLRPWLQNFCQLLRCDIKLRRDTDQIHIISREIRSHPRYKNALLIKLTLRNDAPFIQPWPTLQLSFSDINNQTIARRNFLPADYLPENSKHSTGMIPQKPILAQLVLIDPGKEAVNFVFDFN